MIVQFSDVGLCTDCPRQTERLACFTLEFARIGHCGGCKNQGQLIVCGGCERDERLLKRRDQHGVTDKTVTCALCQRDLDLLKRRDRYEKGEASLPPAAKKLMDRVDDEVGRTPHKAAIQSWLREV